MANFVCPANCGRENIYGLDQLLTHLEQACLNTPVTCAECETKGSRSDNLEYGHNCMEALKTENRSLKK